MPFLNAPNQSVRWLFAELLVVVIGILIAFQVDEWREHRRSQDELRQHLLNLHAEINGNIFTLENVMWDLENTKIPALENAISFFSSQEINNGESEALIKTLMESASPVRPWLVQSSLDSFKASDSYSLLAELEGGLRLGGSYEAYSVLINQVDIIGNEYITEVQSYVPANYQAELNSMATYFSASSAPIIADPADKEHVVLEIQRNAAHLLPLARMEAAAATGNWYAISRAAAQFYRIRGDIESMLSQIYPDWREFSRRRQSNSRTLRSLEP